MPKEDVQMTDLSKEHLETRPAPNVVHHATQDELPQEVSGARVCREDLLP